MPYGCHRLQACLMSLPFWLAQIHSKAGKLRSPFCLTCYRYFSSDRGFLHRISFPQMGFPNFPNVCAGLVPMIIINIAIKFTAMKQTLNSLLRMLGVADPRQINPHSRRLIFQEEYERPSDIISLPRFPEEVLQALPLTVYHSTTINLMEVECPICLSEYEEGQEIRVLRECKHAYHKHCLDGWLEHHHTTCPLCRSWMVPADVMRQRFG
ncbi:hypothetical protein KP509_03G012300 [Ceratopteris richardii]|uniref:RING-type domain-containing protein n=1 Tax=Ceratopteris richardii TaxID=49495 RepID=A0A8T2V4K4_CERRI|nr:hypothetical protein KP509_03G012300 [Ceratopteris richardii]